MSTQPPPPPPPYTTNYATNYGMPPSGVQPNVAGGQTVVAPPPPPMPASGVVYVHRTEDSTLESMKNAIPALPMCLAITFLCINCVLPGIGTICAGFASLCCAETKGVQTGKLGLFCINFWCGFAQLLLVIFAIGWMWSIMWGVLMVHEASRRLSESKGTSTISPQQY